MARPVIWSTRAVDDLEAVASYIAQDSQFYAASVVRGILQKTRTLTEFPFIGRIVHGFDDEAVREIFAYSYRIIYRIEQDQIDIAAVIHDKRRFDTSLKP